MMANGYDSYNARSKDYETSKIAKWTHIIRCIVCECEDLSVNYKLPKGWNTTKQGCYKLCEECSAKLREKYKEGK